jgi:Fe-S cluster biogenesis protein NfuA
MDEELRAQVEDALDLMRPFLIADGGNMELVNITEDMIVQLRLLGSCKSCNMSEMTLKAGVEEAVKRAVPQIRAVESINS